jgi:hypothetical protein
MARLLSVTARLGRRGAFFRDALGLCSVDAGHGWLIFALPRAEADFSPSASNGRHELSLLRDDVHAEIEGLREKGLTRSKGPAPHGAGIRGRRDGEGGEQERIREGIGLCESQWPPSAARSGCVAVVMVQYAPEALTAPDGTRCSQVGRLRADDPARKTPCGPITRPTAQHSTAQHPNA